MPTSAAEPSPVDVTHLTSTQQGEMKALFDLGLFQERPGFTNLVQYNIYLKEAAPSQKRSYHIPEQLLPALRFS